MILKIGFTGKEGSTTWKYFHDITDIEIDPIDSQVYFYDKKLNKIFFKPDMPLITDDGNGGEEEHDGAMVDLSDVVERMFDGRCCEVDTMWLVLVSFTDSQGDERRLGCCYGTVFLMNDEGKTVDKY